MTTVILTVNTVDGGSYSMSIPLPTEDRAWLAWNQLQQILENGGAYENVHRLPVPARVDPQVAA